MRWVRPMGSYPLYRNTLITLNREKGFGLWTESLIVLGDTLVAHHWFRLRSRRNSAEKMSPFLRLGFSEPQMPSCGGFTLPARMP